MKISNSAKYVIGVTAAVALLAGCSNGGGSQLASGGSMVPSAHQVMGSNHKVLNTLLTPPSVRQVTPHPTISHPMKPNCCGYAKLLYVSDAIGGASFTGAVQVFNWPSGTYVGALAAPPEGWSQPQGECVDNKGNVYVANTSRSTIDEFSHSGTFVQALQDSGQYPVGCSFDQGNGNLVVSNIITTSGGAGSLSIYTGATGSPTVVAVPNMARVYFIATAGKTGVTYFDGSDSSGAFQYDSYTDSSNAVTPITVSGGSILFPGSVMFSRMNRWVNVGDQDTFSSPTFYQLSQTSATTATIVGSTVTTCPTSVCDIVQGSIKGPRLDGPDAVQLTANIFPYPAGGSPTTTISGVFNQPIGSAISPAVP